MEEYCIDDFIRELQSISEEKRKLPLVIRAPNGLLFQPKIKRIHKNDLPFDDVIKMIITF